MVQAADIIPHTNPQSSRGAVTATCEQLRLVVAPYGERDRAIELMVKPALIA